MKRRRSVAVDYNVRGRCHSLIRELNTAGVIPEPFSLSTFIEQLGRYRGRRIELVSASMARESPCGLWISAGSTDYIFYARSTSPLHQCHIVLHELGHLAFDHGAGGMQLDELARLIAPTLDPALINRMLGRSTYGSPAEHEAEAFADLLLAPRVFAPAADSLTPRPDLPPDVAEVLRNIERVWGMKGI